MNEEITCVYIARIVKGRFPKIGVQKYEVLSEKDDSLVIKNDNDVRLFPKSNLGKADTDRPRLTEEGYGLTSDEAIEAYRKGMKAKARLLHHLANLITEDSERPALPQQQSEQELCGPVKIIQPAKSESIPLEGSPVDCASGVASIMSSEEMPAYADAMF